MMDPRRKRSARSGAAAEADPPTAEEMRLQLRIEELGAAMKAMQSEFLDMVDQLQEREEEAVRRALRELRGLEERYTLVARATNDVIWEWNLDTGEVTWNEALRTVLGYEPAEAGGTIEDAWAWWSERIHPEDRDRVQHILDGTVEGGADHWSAEYRFRTAGGAYATVLDRALIVRNERGEARRMVGSMLDLTERVEYQERLEEAERRARFLAEASRALATSLEYTATFQTIADLAVSELADWCVVDIVDDEGALRSVAMAAPDEGKRHLLIDYLRRYPPDIHDAGGPALVVRTGEPLLAEDVTDEALAEFARDQRQLRFLRRLGIGSVLIVPMRARGRVAGTISMATARPGRRYGPEDVGLALELADRAALAVDNAQLYGAALVASQAKSDFLAVISHELRTPLNAIIGYTDLLQMGVPVSIPADAGEHVQRVRRAANHLLQLIEEVLTFSRVDAAKEEVSGEAVDIGELVEEVCELAEPLAIDKGLAFHVRKPKPPLRIWTDRGKVRQILLNLLSNAVKFTPAGSVSLEVTQAGGAIRFRVVDTGIGIEAGHLRRIFDPFWQVQQGRARQQGGTGLGLSVSRQLAHMLGGDVLVESEPGRGSQFTLELPLRMPPSTSGDHVGAGGHGESEGDVGSVGHADSKGDADSVGHADPGKRVDSKGDVDPDGRAYPGNHVDSEGDADPDEHVDSGGHPESGDAP